MRLKTFIRTTFILVLLLGGALATAFAAKDFNIKNEDASYLFVDGTSGNVGVGSTIPQQKLDVNGIVNATGLYVNGTPYIGSQWTTAGSDVYYSTGNVGIGTDSPGAVLTISSATDPMIKVIDSDRSGNIKMGVVDYSGVGYPGIWLNQSDPTVSNYAFLGSAAHTFFNTASGGNLYFGINNQYKMMVDTNGNVGIGTTLPTSLLHVHGSYSGGVDNLIPQMKIVNASTSGGYAFIKTMMGSGFGAGYPEIWVQATGPASTAGTVSIRGVSNHDMTFQSNNTEWMRLTRGGNVGIGTTVPASKLDVLGASRILSDVGTASVGYATSAGSLYIQNDLEIDGNVYLGDVITDSLTVAGTMTLAGATNYTGNVGLSSATPTAQLDIKNNGTVPFRITNAAAGDYVTVTSAGYVGIGTVSPYSVFHIHGGPNQYAFLSVGNSTTDHPFTGIVGADIAGRMSTRGSSGGGMLFSGFGESAGMPGMTFQGHVGSAAPTKPGVVFEGWKSDGGASRSAMTGTDKIAQFAAGDVYAGTATIAMTVLANANVGIGSTTPLSKLDVTGGAARILSGTSSPSVGYATSAGSLYIQNDLEIDGNVYLGDVITDSLTVAGTMTLAGATNYTGNVGLSSATPTAQLDIKNNSTVPFQITNASAGDYVTVTSAGYVGIKKAVPGVELDVTGTIRASNNLYATGLSVNRIKGNTLDLNFMNSTDSSSYMTILSSTGNVGIGTTAPLAKLDIGVGAIGPAFMVSSNNGNSTHGDYVTVTSAGRVGIGSTSPGYSLDVNGDISVAISSILRTGSYASLSGTAQALNINSAASPRDTNFYNGTTTPVMFIGRSGGSYSSNVGIGSTSPLSKLDVTGGAARILIGDGTSTAGYATQPGDLYVQNNLEIDGNVYLGDVITDSLTVAGTMTLAGATNYTGNVGLSSATPTAQLDIKNNSTVPFQITNAAAGDYLTVTSAGNMGIGTAIPTTPLHIQRASNGNFLRLVDASNVNQDYTFETESIGINYGLNLKNRSGSTIVNFDPSQRLGIATNNPTVPLEINAQGANALQLRIGGHFGLGIDNGGQIRSIIGSDYGNAATVMSFTLGGFTTASDKMTILGSGNVGIGTITPLAKFDIAVGTTGPALMVSSNQGNSTHGDYLTVTSTGLVGIGTTSPGAGLHLLSNSGLRISNATAPSQTLEIISQGVSEVAAAYSLQLTAKSSHSSYGNILFATGGTTERVRISNSGNVGIGTTVPASKLDVVGGAARVMSDVGTASVGYATSAGSLYIQNDLEIDGNVYLGDVITDSLTVAGTMTLAGATNYTGNVGLSSATPTAQLDIKNNSTVPFQITNASAGDYLTVTSAGYVGIGTASPGYPLQVVGSVNTSSYFSAGASVFGVLPVTSYGIYYGSKAADQLGVDQVRAGGAYPWIMSSGDGVTKTGGAITFKVDGISALAIIDTGNVGIGTTAPTEKLSILNTIDADANLLSLKGLGGNLTNKAVGLLFGSALYPTFNKAGIFFESLNSDGSGNLYLATTDTNGAYTVSKNDAKMTINNAGNVGIGTTVPQQKLEVSSDDSGHRGIKIKNTNSSGYAMLQLDRPSNVRGSVINYSTAGTADWYTGTLYNGGSASTAYSISTDNTITNSKLMISSAGNVGIGTTRPLARLSVRDETDGGKLSVGSAANLNAVIALAPYTSGIGEDYWKLTANNSALSYRFDISAGVNKWLNILYDTGNVGIGSTAPRQKLDVNGVVNAAGYYLDGAPFTSSQWTTASADIYYGDGNVGLNSATPTAQLDIKNNSTVPFQITNAAAGDYVTVTSGGNVGIGTAVPVAKFEVSSLSDIAGDTVVKFRHRWGVNSLDQKQRYGIIVQSHDTNVALGVSNQSYNTMLQGFSNAGAYMGIALNPLGGSVVVGRNLVGSSDDGARFVIRGIGATSGTTALRIEDSNGNSKFVIKNDGNVGIGTTASLAKLDIAVGTTGPAFMISSNNGNSTHGDYLTVTSTGSMGIGTTSPAYKLEVVGQIKASSLIYSGSAYLGPAGIYGIDYKINSNGNLTLQGSNSLLFISGGGSNEKMRIDSSGNVGIGTITPLAKLHIGDAASTPDAMSITGNDAYIKGNIEFDGAIYGDGSQLTGINSSQWTTASADIYYGTGNVGVGTTTPVAKTHIYNNVADASTALIVDQHDSSSTGKIIDLQFNGSSVSWFDKYGVLLTNAGIRSTNQNLRVTTASSGLEINKISGTGNIALFQYNDVTKAVVSSDGNVGIGTTVPLATLQVGNNPTIPADSAPAVAVKNNVVVDGNIYGTQFHFGANAYMKYNAATESIDFVIN